jgi:hypothetical protein
MGCMSDAADGSTASVTGALGTRDAFKFCVKEVCRDDTHFHAMRSDVNGRFDYSLIMDVSIIHSADCTLVYSLKGHCVATAMRKRINTATWIPGSNFI